MTRLTVNDVNYNVQVQGSGIPLVMLHGFTGSHANWDDLALRLSATFTVITIDLLGHGKSDAPADPDRYRMEHVAADLAKLFQALVACPVNLLGYSMGGRLALYMARHYPELVRSLVLESASPGLADSHARAERRASDAQLAARIEAEGIPAFVDYWENISLFASQRALPSDVQAALRTQRLDNRSTGLANSLRGMGTGQQPSLWDELALVRQPVLLMAGALDEKFVGIAHRMAARLPHARTLIVPDAGHTVHLEAPQAFLMQVLMFIHSVQFSAPGEEVIACPTPLLSLAAAAR